MDEDEAADNESEQAEAEQEDFGSEFTENDEEGGVSVLTSE